MKKRTSLALYAAFFAYGTAVGTYQIFPFHQLHSLKAMISPADTTERVYYKNKVEFYRQMNKETFDVVFVGDSITDGAEWSEMYPTLKTANRGIGGDTTGDVLNRIDTVVDTKAEVAFIMLGINDISKGVPLKITLTNYRQIVGELSQAGMRVMIQSTLLTDSQTLNSQVNVLNQKLYELAYEKGLSFVDLNSKLAESGRLKSEFSYDGVHLRGNAYRVWGEEIKRFLGMG